MKRKKILKSRQLSLALALALASTMAAGQSTTGAIFGDVSGLKADSVLLTSDTGFTREIPIDSHGHYATAQIPVGVYSVSLKRGGQVVDKRNDVIVRVGSGVGVSFGTVASSPSTAGGVSAKNLGGIQVQANALPPIDVTSVDSRTVVTSEQLAKLPLGRTAEAIAQLAPGVVNNSGGFSSATGSSLVSFGGSSAGENAYYINGFNTTDPLKGAGGLTLPYGAIDQEEVYTGGYSAQYGRSDGGVINMVGKRGTNEWHFGAQVLWQPEFAQASQQNIYYTDGTGLYDPKSRSHSWTTTVDAYLGGPLIKDKLFFFVAGEAQKQEGNSVASVEANSPDTEYKYKLPKWYGKLDWNITDSNILELTGASNKEETSGKIYNYDYDDYKREGLKGYSDNTKTGGDLWSAKFTSYITDDLTLTALYGKMKTVSYDQPANYDDSLTYVAGLTYQNPAITGGTPIGNNQTVSSLSSADRSNKTSNMRIDLTYKIGDHTISAGIDNQKAQAIDQGSHTSADGYYWSYAHTDDPSADLVSGLGVGAPADYPNGATGYYVGKIVSSSLSTVRSRQRAQYIEDKWQISDRWLVSIGLRNDQYTDYNTEGTAFISQTKPQWAPRIGFSWDVNGDGSFKVFGNAGRYYLGLPLQPSVDAASGNVSTTQYFTYSGIAADGTPTGLTAMSNPVSANNDFGQAPDAKTVTAKNIKAEDQDEYILGFDKAFGPNWVYGAKLTFRNLRNAVDDFCDVSVIHNAALAEGFTDSSPNSCYLINPGRSNSFTVVDENGNYREVTISNAQFGFPKLKRRYYALDQYIEHPFDGTWYGKLSYTFSRSYGNTEGQERSDLRQFGASESEDWDNSYIMENTNGPQNNDHTHQIKFDGYYQLTPEWMVSSTIQLTSGAPKNCIGYYGPNGDQDPAGYGSSYHWCFGKPSPPGSQGHLPWMKEVDLGVSYSPSFASHKLAFTLNVFNLFNGHAPLNINADSQQSPNSASPTYGITEYQQTPRYVRLGVTYDY